MDLSQILSSFAAPRRRRYKLLVLMLLASGLIGCESLDQYHITLNDRTLYTPRDLFADYDLPDLALSNCINQAIEDGQVFSADSLKFLTVRRLASSLYRVYLASGDSNV